MDNKYYAYLLLGAVLLAGVAGFMISDSMQEEKFTASNMPAATGFSISLTVLDEAITINEGEELSNGS